MDNVNQNAQGAEPQAGLPSLGDLLSGNNAPVTQEPVVIADQGQGDQNQQQQGQQWQQGQQQQVDVTQQQQQQVDPNAPIEEMTIELLLSADDSTLSEENRSLKQETFSTFGATNVDGHGNLINANGQVVLSKGNFDKYLETGEVLTDAKGNQINEQGIIIKPASEVAVNSTITEVSRATIEQELGFKLLDEKGQPKYYANSAEGNTELLRDIANNAQINAVASFLESNPKLKDVYFHLAQGKDLTNYVTNDVDYSAIDVSALERADKLNYIKQSFAKQGLKNSESLIKTLELASDDALTSATADAVLALKQITEEDKTKREADYQAQQAREEENNAEYWKNVNSVITKGSLKDIKIPDAEKESFFKYLAVPVNSKGESQEMIDADGDETENRLMLSYLRYKKFNLSELVNIKAGANKVNSLRERLGQANPRIENAQARTNGQPSKLDGAGFPTLKDLTSR